MLDSLASRTVPFVFSSSNHLRKFSLVLIIPFPFENPSHWPLSFSISSLTHFTYNLMLGHFMRMPDSLACFRGPLVKSSVLVTSRQSRYIVKLDFEEKGQARWVGLRGRFLCGFLGFGHCGVYNEAL